MSRREASLLGQLGRQLGGLTGRVRRRVSREIASVLRSRGFVHVDDFVAPYIIEKDVEGVRFLCWITDRHARIWYHLHAGDPEWPEMRFIRDQLVRPGMTVIECGSHHGVTAMCLASWVGDAGTVIAIEPDRRNRDTLARNLALNHIRNVEVVHAAVGDVRGTVRFAEQAQDSMGSYVVPDSAAAAGETIAQITVDELAARRPGLIKLDVQGYVWPVLRGATETLKALAPHLAIELDEPEAIRAYGHDPDDIVSFLGALPHDFFALLPGEKEARPIARSAIRETWGSRQIHLFARSQTRA